MGYRITYDPACRYHKQDSRKSRSVVLTGLAFAMFLWLVGNFWEEGRVVAIALGTAAINRLKELVLWCGEILKPDGVGML